MKNYQSKTFPTSRVYRTRRNLWELHWCSGLSWIAVLSGVFHNGTWAVSAWCIAPGGESALRTNLSVPSQRKVEWHTQASAIMAPHYIQNLLSIDGMAFLSVKETSWMIIRRPLRFCRCCFYCDYLRKYFVSKIFPVRLFDCSSSVIL